MKDQDFIFVADEACISNDRYTVVGGICMHKNTVDQVLNTLSKYRKDYNMLAELKWSKISPQKLLEYEFLVDYFFAMNNVNHLQFYCLVFDSHQWNHKKFNDGDRDVGLSKLYYQLMLHKFVKNCGKSGTCYARIDKRNSTTVIEDVRKMINKAAYSKFGYCDSPLKQIVPMDSKNCDILQLNDVILGAVGAARNGKHLLGGGNQAKKAIAKKVIELSGLENFSIDTPSNITRFTVWNFKHSK